MTTEMSQQTADYKNIRHYSGNNYGQRFKLESALRSGITLLEIIIALLIMTSVMIPISSLMGYGGSATKKDARRITAIQLLDKTMREILQTEFKLIPVGNDIKTPFGATHLGTVTSSAGVEYTVSLSSNYISPAVFSFQNIRVNLPDFKPEEPKDTDFTGAETISLANCVKSLIVTVSWVEQQSIPVQVSAISYSADFARRKS